MEIIFVVANMTGGGTERVISVLANQFIAEGHRVGILMTAGDTVAYPLDPKIRLVSLGGQTGGSVLKRIGRIQKMRRFFKQHKEAVICAMGIETNLFTVLAARGLSNRVLISERNDPGQCSYAAVRNFLYGMADVLVCQTTDAAKAFPGRAGKKSVVIPNPIAPDLPAPFHGERKKEIVAAGRLTPQKNHALLLQAFSSFTPAHPEYTLVIYGKGELEQALREQIRALHLEERVKLPGFAENLPEKIRESAMYVLSSDYEGISNSLSEAMAMGLPVISTDCPIGGSKMCIRQGENGLLVPVGDKDALAQAMSRLAEEPSYAAKLGEEAEKLRDQYSVEAISAKWIFCMQKDPA